jgi:hypothetical protein
MGGFGSGKRPTRRAAVEDCLTLSVAALRRDGVLRPGWSGAWRWERGQRIEIETEADGIRDSRLRISYTRTQDGQAQSVAQEVPVRWDPVFRGLRPWLHCPRCRSRRAAVHLPPCVPWFGCTGCYGLTYRSVQEHDARVDRIRRHLRPEDVGEPDLDAPGLYFPLVLARMLGPLVRRDPRFPRRKALRCSEIPQRGPWDFGRADLETPTADGRAAP